MLSDIKNCKSCLQKLNYIFEKVGQCIVCLQQLKLEKVLHVQCGVIAEEVAR